MRVVVDDNADSATILAMLLQFQGPEIRNAAEQPASRAAQRCRRRLASPNTARPPASSMANVVGSGTTWIRLPRA